MMNELNAIWKKHTGSDLTTEESWKMVEFVGMLLENADKNINKEDKKDSITQQAIKTGTVSVQERQQDEQGER